MAGSPGLPHPLHAWSPIIKAGTGTTRSAPLSRAAGVGRGDRAGVGVPRALGLARGAAGRKGVGGVGGEHALTLALGVATGVRPAKQAFGGAEPTARGLTVQPSNILGVKTVNGLGDSTFLLLTVKPASGQPAKQGRGLVFSLSCRLPVVQGSKHVDSTARRPMALTFHVRPSDRGKPGIHREFFLQSPTEDAYELVHPLRSQRLIARVPYGMTLYRLDGVWHTALAPNRDRLAGADRVYPGGRIAPLSDVARDELIAAGFGKNITLMEVR